MKRILATTALALSSILCVPAMAQQAPVSPNAPNPSAPPAPEGPANPRSNTAPGTMPGSAMSSGNMSSGSGMQHDSTKSTKKNTGDRAKKPRQQNAPPYPTADAPSGPKGDSPDPAPKQ